MDTPPENDRFDAINSIFADALERPPEEREAFVRERCGEDSAMRGSVLRLLERFEGLSGFLVPPTVGPFGLAATTLQPGERLGDFHVIDRIGSGGMGTVYRVENTKIGEIQALKVLHARVAGDPAMAARFRDEIRLAHRIDHPNVCPVYDLFSERRGGADIVFLTMKCLDGETLDQRLAREPLERSAALALARQIASGLDAAHRIGVVHRDLKPANILLVSERDGSLRAVITDFGLAKALDSPPGGAGHTVTGQIMGTPTYMAPEQFLGSHVDGAADIFAFGLIVFEMLTGHRPFDGNDPIRLAVRRITGSPASVSGFVPHLPPHWDAVFRRALANNPKARHATATAIVEALDRPAGPFLWRPSRRAVIFSGLAAAGVSLFFAGRRLREWTLPLPERPLIFVTPLSHPSSSAETASTARAVDLLLANQIQQSAHLTQVARDAAESAWERLAGDRSRMPTTLSPEHAREIALRCGAQFVLWESLADLAGERTLRLRLEWLGSDPAAPRRAWRTEFSAPHDSDLPSAVYDGANWLRRTVGESAAQLDTRSRRPEALTSSSWHALQEFAQSDDAWRAREQESALRHLHEALRIDPDFALAAGRLGDMLTATNRLDEGLAAYEQAERLLIARNLTDRESLQIRGSFAFDTARYEESDRVWALCAERYPDDPLPLYFRADSLDRLGRLDEAVRLLDRAVILRPDFRSAVFRRACAHLDQGRLDDAASGCESAARLAMDYWVEQLRSALAFGRLDFAGAWDRIEKMRVLNPGPAFEFQALYRFEEHRPEDALRLLEAAAAAYRASFAPARAVHNNRLRRAQVLFSAGRSPEGLRECNEVLSGQPAVETRLQTACVLARYGRTSEAAQHLPSTPLKWPAHQYWAQRLQAELLAAKGSTSAALHLMRALPSARWMGEWPLFHVRLAHRSGDLDAVRASLSALFANPGKFWYQALKSEPGFLNAALRLADQIDFVPPTPEAARTRSALAKSFKEK